MTTDPRINERAINAFIARVMEKQAPPDYTVDVEVHGQGRLDSTAPDIVVRMPYGLRAIIETEYGQPAVNDAIQRLGYEFHDHTRDIKNVIALGIPNRLGASSLRYADRDVELESDTPHFLMQIVTGRAPDDPEIVLTPSKPVSVSLRDVIQYCWLAAIPEVYANDMLAKVIAELRTARNELANLLKEQNDRLWENGLGFKYGNPNSESPAVSATGNIVGTLVSMVELHRNLQQWENCLMCCRSMTPICGMRYQATGYQVESQRSGAQSRPSITVLYPPSLRTCLKMVNYHPFSAELSGRYTRRLRITSKLV